MEDLTYTPIGSVLHLDKAGELAQKRMKAAKLCDGLYITEPDKTQFVKFIVEYNGVKWVEHQAPAERANPDIMAKRMPAILASIEGGRLNELNDYHKELHRRIFNPDAPVIMELKKPERKKAAPLPEGAKKVNVLMFKGCTDEATDKKVIITEVAPHVYTYTYKLKRYGERVKIIFEIDGIYFQGADNGAYVMAREDFNEICAKAYEHARENVADGAAKGMRYFVEVQKRIDAATPTEMPQISIEAAEAVTASAESETREIKHISEIMGTCCTYDPETKDYTDQYKYYTWLASHQPGNTASNANIVEICINEVRERIATAANLTAHNIPKQDMAGAVYAIVNRLTTIDEALQLYAPIEPPQSPETPQTVNHTVDTPKPRETARKEQKRTISKKERVHAWQKLGAQGYLMLADASATLAAINAPPIRGDCKIGISQRAKPPNRIQYTKTNILQPP